MEAAAARQFFCGLPPFARAFYQASLHGLFLPWGHLHPVIIRVQPAIPACGPDLDLFSLQWPDRKRPAPGVPVVFHGLHVGDVQGVVPLQLGYQVLP